MPIASSTLDTTVPYGELSVIRYAYYGGGHAGHFWRCRCSCGRELTVAEFNLRNGKQLSCGHARRRPGPLAGYRVVLPDGRRFATTKEAAAALHTTPEAVNQRIARDRRKGLANGWRREPAT